MFSYLYYGTLAVIFIDSHIQLIIYHTITSVLSVPSFTFAVSGDITFTLIKTDDSKINAFVMHGSSISSNTMSCHLLDLIKQYTKVSEVHYIYGGLGDANGTERSV